MHVPGTRRRRPSVGRARDDGLWREYRDALGSARSRRQEQREALSSKIDAALEQLVRVAKQRFGTKQVMLLGTRRAQKRLAQMAEERGLDIAEERQR